MHFKVNGGDGGECAFSVIRKGNGGPVIFWGTFLHQENTVEHLLEALEKEIPGKEYTLVPFVPEDWNRDFSPWAAPPAFGDETFEGKGPETLRWLREELIPEIVSELGENRPLYLVGYSLAGLFSLWTAYETDIFDGIACCSGSLWFEGWAAYAEQHRIQHPCEVYLSLGGKEEKTRNQVMARVGDRTREQEKLLKREPMVRAAILEWNSGGHFADSGKRLARGIRWLMNGENAWKNENRRPSPHFRKSTMDDIDQMVRIANEGKALLKSKGINQWQRGTYPDGPLFIQDVADGIGYVLAQESEVLAICAVTYTDEESYRHLTSGAWLTADDAKYATIHRGAVAAAHHGEHLSIELFNSVAEMARENAAASVRADTHPDNLVMQGALRRAGFQYCGEFYILEGDEAGDLRYGYELLL